VNSTTIDLDDEVTQQEKSVRQRKEVPRRAPPGGGAPSRPRAAQPLRAGAAFDHLAGAVGGAGR
jgi:hypothetical protein